MAPKGSWQPTRPKPPAKPCYPAELQAKVSEQAVAVVCKIEKPLCPRPQNPYCNWCENIFVRWPYGSPYPVGVIATISILVGSFASAATAARFSAGRARRAAWSVFMALSVLAYACVPIFAAEPINLALNKPASSSSVENDEHNAAKANDGNAETCWSADDEPVGGPEWWQVDLEKPFDLSGCQIRWPFDGKRYRYKVEGSTDGTHWSLLSDQTKTTSTVQVHNLKFLHARQVRFVKITVTGLDDGCWVSICEVKVFGINKSGGIP